MRLVKPEDHSYIYKTWLTSYRNSDAARNLSNQVYFNTENKVIESCLNNENTCIYYDPEDQDHILGYVSFTRIFQDAPMTFKLTKDAEPMNAKHAVYLHYLFIREAFRKQHLATEALKLIAPTKETILVMTHPIQESYQLFTPNFTLVTERKFESICYQNLKETNELSSSTSNVQRSSKL